MPKKPSKVVLKVAQELSFARALASNDKSLRDRALKRMKRWFASLPATDESFSEDSFSRIWKGLYYCVWMSDKPLIQEDCVESISTLVHALKNPKDARNFVRSFFNCMTLSWFNLDGHRIDKYMMLVRRMLRQMFERLHQDDWNQRSVKEIVRYDLTPSLVAAPLGLTIHVAEIYLEELAKVGRGKLSSGIVSELVKPFGELMSTTKDLRLMHCITENIFFHLLRQTDEALKHEAKFQAWRQSGFPGGDIETMEEVHDEENCNEDIFNGDDSDDLEEDEEPALDPRAGRVDVELPPLEFNPSQIVNYLNKLKQNSNMSTKARKQIGFIVSKYKTYQAGRYPFGIHKVELIEQEDERELVDEAAEELAAAERQLIDESDLNGGKKRKKRSADEEVVAKVGRKSTKRAVVDATWKTSPLKVAAIVSPCSSPATNGDWTVSPSLLLQNGTKSRSSQSVRAEFVETPSSSSDRHSLPADSTPTRATAHKQKIDSSDSPTTASAKKRNTPKRGSGGLDPPTSSSPWGGTTDWDNSATGVEISATPLQSSLTELQTNLLLTPLLNEQTLTSGSAKKVEFVLHRNTAQEEREYKLSLKKRPSLPFDALRKPPHSVLKQTPTTSPAAQFPPSLAEIS